MISYTRILHSEHGGRCNPENYTEGTGDTQCRFGTPCNIVTDTGWAYTEFLCKLFLCHPFFFDG